MPRIARAVAVGYPHHITQRGNYRQKIFAGPADYKRYTSLLKDESKRYHVAIIAYCLMPNHVHFIALPGKEDSLANVFKYVNMKYSQYYNRKMRAYGHLFQGRYYSCIMDERHTIACARYIERNPIRAKLVNKPHLWEWSSAKAHCGISKHDTLAVNNLFDVIEYNQKDWKGFIEEQDDPDEIKQLRENTRKGRPLGSGEFVEKLEEKLNRSLKLKPKGRPKKK